MKALAREKNSNKQTIKDLEKTKNDWKDEWLTEWRKNRTLTTERNNLQQDLNSLQNNLKRILINSLFKNKRTRELNNCLSFLRGLLVGKNQEVTNLITQSNNLQTQLNQTQTERNNSQNQVNHLNQQLTTKNTQITNLTNEVNRLNNELQKEQGWWDKWENDYYPNFIYTTRQDDNSPLVSRIIFPGVPSTEMLLPHSDITSGGINYRYIGYNSFGSGKKFIEMMKTKFYQYYRDK